MVKLVGRQATSRPTLMVGLEEVTCHQILSLDKFQFKFIEIVKDQETERLASMFQSAMETEELLQECHHSLLQEIQGIENNLV